MARFCTFRNLLLAERVKFITRHAKGLHFLELFASFARFPMSECFSITLLIDENVKEACAQSFQCVPLQNDFNRTDNFILTDICDIVSTTASQHALQIDLHGELQRAQRKNAIFTKPLLCTVVRFIAWMWKDGAPSRRLQSRAFR